MNDCIVKGSKGGIARAKNLSAETKKLIGQMGARVKNANRKLPKETHNGDLIIGDMILDVAILENGIRIISSSSIFKALQRPRRGVRLIANKEPMPPFLEANNLKPYISQDLYSKKDPIKYRSNKVIKEGFDATILPMVCETYLKARDANVLYDIQLSVARKADVLIRALAKTGIIALVDEATGYQKDRAANALATILEKFVAEELQPWVKTFPTAYYENLFRVWGLPFSADSIHKRPSFMGSITNNVIYDRLAPNLREELKDIVSKSERKAKMHQYLSREVGHPKLREHLSSIVTLLKLSNDKDEFIQLVDRIHPKIEDKS